MHSDEETIQFGFKLFGILKTFYNCLKDFKKHVIPVFGFYPGYQLLLLVCYHAVY